MIKNNFRNYALWFCYSFDANKIFINAMRDYIFFVTLFFVYSKRESTFNDIINWCSNERCPPDKIRNKSFINRVRSLARSCRFDMVIKSCPRRYLIRRNSTDRFASSGDRNLPALKLPFFFNFRQLRAVLVKVLEIPDNGTANDRVNRRG